MNNGEGGRKSLKVCKHLLCMAPIEFKFVLSSFKFDHMTGEYFTDQSVISTRDSFSRTISVQCVSLYMGAKQKKANVSIVFFFDTS